MNCLFRLLAMAFLVALAVLSPSESHAQSSHDVVKKAGILKSIEVPFDRANPSLGSFQLEYEIGRSYDLSKPTVFVIADGQQFYVRKGAVAPLQDELFGDRFNVVGIIGRGSNEAVRAKLRKDGQVDWLLAYDLLRSDEWVDDIETARRAIVGDNGLISLYGRSGGGLLVYQYLAKYPAHVRNVFTQAAVNRFVDAELGLNSDKFWDEIGHENPALQKELLTAMAAHPRDRDRVLLLLQRQNFFVAAEQLGHARELLIHAIAEWDGEKLQEYSRQYQVDEILKQFAQSEDPATNVRVFELMAPVSVLFADSVRDAPSRVDPDYEVGRLVGAPLFALLGAGKIPIPQMDLSTLNRVNASVYLLAGYFDHTADYRSQIALASRFSLHHLLLLNDDHDFLALAKTGLYSQLIQAALLDGCNSEDVRRVEAQLAPLRHSEF